MCKAKEALISQTCQRFQGENRVSCQVTVGVGVTGIDVSSTLRLSINPPQERLWSGEVELGLPCRTWEAFAEGAHPENPDSKMTVPLTSWLAAPRSLQTREAMCVGNVASIQPDRASIHAFLERPHVCGAVHLFPVHQGNTFGSPVVSPPDGLSLGGQLAIDTTLVSVLSADGTRVATTPGAGLADARSRKETTYPELVAEPSWSSWLQKSEDVGLRRRLSSLVRWWHPKHGQRQRLCKRRWFTLGGTVGEG